MFQTITFLGGFLPKSLLLLLSSFLIYDFHATFDAGPAAVCVRAVLKGVRASRVKGACVPVVLRGRACQSG